MWSVQDFLFLHRRMPSIRSIAMAVVGLASLIGDGPPQGRAAAIDAGLAAPLAQSRTLVRHDFEGTTHGWLVSGDTGAVHPQLLSSGGHPAGHIAHADEAVGETWYFSAPDSVVRALAAAEHGSLSYDLKQSADVVGNFEDDVVIVGPAGRLSYRFRESPGTEWATFTVRLSAESGWRWNWNAPATQEQIRRVLATATSLEIRGEYHTGPDEGALDSVVLRTGGSPGLLRSEAADIVARPRRQGRRPRPNADGPRPSGRPRGRHRDTLTRSVCALASW